MSTANATTLAKVNQLVEAGGFLIGSKALRVATPDSDYDVAIYLDDLPQEERSLIDANPLDYDMQKYFNHYPPMGNSYLIREYNNIDILVFDNKDNINDVRNTINELIRFPTCYLRYKSMRITLFEIGLESRGWLPSEPISDSAAV